MKDRKVICNLFKPTTGKWYGEFTFMWNGVGVLTDEMILEKGDSQYSNLKDYYIHVLVEGEFNQYHRLIFPK